VQLRKPPFDDANGFRQGIVVVDDRCRRGTGRRRRRCGRRRPKAHASKVERVHNHVIQQAL
jgi:hypothetical protein